jgi:predicted alpha/beta hydrolase
MANLQDTPARLGAAAGGERLHARVMPQPLELAIPTADGRHVAALLHEPVGEPVAQVVIHGATATPQRFYGSFARHLAWRGFRVLTYDYRGIGRSRVEPLADERVTMDGWLDDAAAAQRWLALRDPATPLLAIGHSFGGQIAATVDAGQSPRALLLVASGSGYWRGYARAQQPRLWVTWRLAMPLFARVFGFVPGWAGLGEDLPAGVGRQWARWCLSPEYFLGERPELRERLAAYDGRVLSLGFSDDAFAPEGNVRWLVGQLRRARTEHRQLRARDVGLPELGHFGAFRATAATTVWPQLVGFLHEAAAGDEGARAPTSPARVLEPFEQEVMADLQYGRA